jgi:Protein of unknown function (DUF3313)
MSIASRSIYPGFGRALALLLGLGALACGAHRRPTPTGMSGFLDNYALLRPGGPGDVRLVYRNPAADWHRYHSVMLEPIAIWRSGRKSLDPVPEDDLLRLAHAFERAVRARLGRSFRLVDRAGPNVLRIRLAITEARATDAVLDVCTVPCGEEVPATGSGPLDAETRRLLGAAVIEGEIVDAETGTLLAQGVDGPRRADAPPLDTWADIDRSFARWADRVCARLEARTGTGPAASKE